MLSLVVRPNFLVEVSQSDTPACSPAHIRGPPTKIPNMCYNDWGPDEVREKLKRGCVSLLHSRTTTALLNDSADLRFHKSGPGRPNKPWQRLVDSEM